MRRVVSLVSNDLRYDQRMIRILTTLAENEFEAILIGRKTNTSPELIEEPFEQLRVSCLFNTGPLFYLELNLRFFFKLIIHKPDIVNTVDADTLLAAQLYKIFRKFIWIHDAHELFTEVPELLNHPIKTKLWAFLENLTIPKTDKVYTVNNSLADFYQKVSKKSVEVIRNFPLPRSNEVVEPKSENPEKVILLYQGALNEGRCVEMYIKAMHRLDGELWLVGEGDLSESLRQLTKKEKLTHKVFFKGWVTPEDLRHLTMMTDIGLNVLENKGQSYFYSLSNKSLDYIQAGIPSLNSAFPEYVALDDQYRVFAFAEPTTDSIVESINLLLNDSAAFESLKKNCKLAARYLVWTTEKEKLLAIYESTR
jgi:glycosyltransferase involved in cell wall biosynthesis